MTRLSEDGAATYRGTKVGYPNGNAVCIYVCVCVCIAVFDFLLHFFLLIHCTLSKTSGISKPLSMCEIAAPSYINPRSLSKLIITG